MDTAISPPIGAAPSEPNALSTDLSKATPDEIKAEIARTRAHMDEHLMQLGRKIKPSVNLRRLQIPLAAAFVAMFGFLVFRAIRQRSNLKIGSGRATRLNVRSSAKVKRLKVRSAGILDQIRALRLAVSVARKGKPAGLARR